MIFSFSSAGLNSSPSGNGGGVVPARPFLISSIMGIREEIKDHHHNHHQHSTQLVIVVVAVVVVVVVVVKVALNTLK